MIKKIRETSDRPRLYVFKSNKHIYVQAIDDYNKKIITGSSTVSLKKYKHANCKNAKNIGKIIGNKLKEKGIEQVVFDRGKNIYHGKVKAVAEGTREAGIKF